jgi:hypothetical protein
LRASAFTGISPATAGVLAKIAKARPTAYLFMFASPVFGVSATCREIGRFPAALLS